ncbi:hypothetical protein AAMO2058_000603600 [Amorphochlora amoebiformis]
MNISVEISCFKSPDTTRAMFDLAIKSVSCTGPSCEKYYISLSARGVWYSKADVKANPRNGTLSVTPYGLDTHILRLFHPKTTTLTKGDDESIRYWINKGPLIATTRKANDVDRDVVLKHMTQMRAQELNCENARGEALSIAHASIMWNLIYTPAEEGPVLPVDRSWNHVPDPVNPDFRYAMFAWDNELASFIALHAGLEEIAVSNWFQSIKSLTAFGFIPNVYAGGVKTQDRTEPPLAGLILEKMVQMKGLNGLIGLAARVSMKALVEYNDWFFNYRLNPDGFISVGSKDYEAILSGAHPSGENMQAARFESGLDNSPMYDGEMYNKSMGLMNLSDVGFSSLVAADGLAIARLLRKVFPSDPSAEFTASRIENRAMALALLVRDRLWNQKLKIFSNQYYGGKPYARITPTSFYPLLTGVVTDEQVTGMIENWLFSRERFCLDREGDVTRNTDTCHWGLPSVSADDPAFPPLGYWRGYVWGPMAQITYWSLEQAASTSGPQAAELANQAMSALARQMGGMGKTQWRLNRHVCENFSPWKNATDCTGSEFYHWGALTVLLEVQQQKSRKIKTQTDNNHASFNVL